MLNRSGDDGSLVENPTEEPQSVMLFSSYISLFLKACFGVELIIERMTNARRNVFEFKSIYSRVFQKETSQISRKDSKSIRLILLPKLEASD